jgi:hypothetical protein
MICNKARLPTAPAKLIAQFDKIQVVVRVKKRSHCIAPPEEAIAYGTSEADRTVRQNSGSGTRKTRSLIIHLLF